jgi:hypothetical protein
LATKQLVSRAAECASTGFLRRADVYIVAISRVVLDQLSLPATYGKSVSVVYVNCVFCSYSKDRYSLYVQFCYFDARRSGSIYEVSAHHSSGILFVWFVKLLFSKYGH